MFIYSLLSFSQTFSRAEQWWGRGPASEKPEFVGNLVSGAVSMGGSLSVNYSSLSTGANRTQLVGDVVVRYHFADLLSLGLIGNFASVIDQNQNSASTAAIGPELGFFPLRSGNLALGILPRVTFGLGGDFDYEYALGAKGALYYFLTPSVALAPFVLGQYVEINELYNRNDVNFGVLFEVFFF